MLKPCNEFTVIVISPGNNDGRTAVCLLRFACYTVSGDAQTLARTSQDISGLS